MDRCGEAPGGSRFLVTAICLLGLLLGAEPALAQQPSATRAPSPGARHTCRLLFGPRVGTFGPNTVLNTAAVVQPGVCWLELSLGFGFDTGTVEGYDEWSDDADAIDFYGDADYFSFTVPLGARVWFMDEHSLLADAGFGLTRYLMSAEVEATSNYGDQSWTRLSTTLVAYAGIGYGYRFNGAQPGPRLAFVVGAFVHLTGLGESTMLGNYPWSRDQLAGLKDDLDEESDELTDLEPYAELSLSWMF